MCDLRADGESICHDSSDEREEKEGLGVIHFPPNYR